MIHNITPLFLYSAGMRDKSTNSKYPTHYLKHRRNYKPNDHKNFRLLFLNQVMINAVHDQQANKAEKANRIKSRSKSKNHTDFKANLRKGRRIKNRIKRHTDHYNNTTKIVKTLQNRANVENLFNVFFVFILAIHCPAPSLFELIIA
jgi:hypothetical protein